MLFTKLIIFNLKYGKLLSLFSRWMVLYDIFNRILNTENCSLKLVFVKSMETTVAAGAEKLEPLILIYAHVPVQLMNVYKKKGELN